MSIDQAVQEVETVGLWSRLVQASTQDPIKKIPKTIVVQVVE
jgi:hypothetical protein